MKTILLDTNFLIEALKRRIDVASQLERAFEDGFTPVVLKEQLAEIERLGPLEARAATTVIDALGIRVEEGGKTDVDDAILAYAKKSGAAVATGDEGLKKRLKKAGVEIITLSNRMLRP